MSNKLCNAVYYCLAAMICMLMLYLLKTADNDLLKLLLYPHAKLTLLYYGIPLSFYNDIGYVSLDRSFAIGRECMGGNFVIMLFAMNAFVFHKHFRAWGKLLWLVFCLLGSIITGVSISCIRIIGSVPFAVNPKFPIIHSGIGISLYFLALTASYVISKRLLGGKEIEEII